MVKKYKRIGQSTPKNPTASLAFVVNWLDYNKT
jgi:hypothetical protein